MTELYLALQWDDNPWLRFKFWIAPKILKIAPWMRRFMKVYVRVMRSGGGEILWCSN